MRYSTLTILFSALLAATALALPSESNHIDVPEAHIDAIDRREVKPTSTSASTSTSTSAAATNTPAAPEKNDEEEGPDFPDETGDRGSVDVPEDDGDDDDDDDDSDDEDEKKKEGK